MNNKKNRTKDAIHQLNNLLTSMGLTAHMLSQEMYGALNAKQKECVHAIVSDCEKIKNLLKKLSNS